MDPVTAERLALNEARFRDVNERLAADVRELVGAGEGIAFVCECSTAACRDAISLTLEQYRGVRSDDLCFAVVPGHEVEEIEAVVGEYDGFRVVRKLQGQDAARRAR